MISVNYASDWLREWHSILDQSQSRVKQNNAFSDYFPDAVEKLFKNLAVHNTRTALEESSITFISHISSQTEGRPSAKTVQGVSSTPLASKPPPVPPTLSPLVEDTGLQVKKP